MKLSLFLFASLAFLFVGCTKVERVDESDVIDLSGNWNDTDMRLVADTMIKDSLSKRWFNNFQGAKGRKPVAVVGMVRNNTAEHINTEPFTKSLERAFVNSGNITVVANNIDRTELRNEIKQMTGNVRPETLKKLRKETGADFLLVGVINDVNDNEKGTSVRFYQVNLELINIESHEKVWIGEKRLKKVVKKSKFGF